MINELKCVSIGFCLHPSLVASVDSSSNWMSVSFHQWQHRFEELSQTRQTWLIVIVSVASIVTMIFLISLGLRSMIGSRLNTSLGHEDVEYVMLHNVDEESESHSQVASSIKQVP
jgi:hypothetical protein